MLIFVYMYTTNLPRQNCYFPFDSLAAVAARSAHSVGLAVGSRHNLHIPGHEPSTPLSRCHAEVFWFNFGAELDVRTLPNAPPFWVTSNSSLRVG